MSLTDTMVRNAKPAGKLYMLYDWKGLYLLVLPGGGKSRRFRYRFPDPNADAVVNYGAISAVIGHEIAAQYDTLEALRGLHVNGRGDPRREYGRLVRHDCGANGNLRKASARKPASVRVAETIPRLADRRCTHADSPGSPSTTSWVNSGRFPAVHRCAV